MKLEKTRIPESTDTNSVFDKISSKEKSKKLKNSKEKSFKADNKLKSEKIILKSKGISLDKTIDKNDSILEKTMKKKISKKKNLEKSLIENNSKINISTNDNKLIDTNINYSEYKSTENKLDGDSYFKLKDNTIKINSSKLILESEMKPDKKKSSLKEDKNKNLNDISNINFTNKNNQIFQLDISGLNSKNNFNILPSNKDIYDISPDMKNTNDNINIDNLMQMKNNNLNAFNINENETNKDIPNLKNLNAFNDNENVYFDQILENIQKKNRDKHVKKNKNIDKLLNSVNANLVNSKIYSGNNLESGLEDKKMDQNKNNLYGPNFNNLLISSNSDIFFENSNRSPAKFDETNQNYSKYEDDNNSNNLISLKNEKNKKGSVKDGLYQIDEVVKKKKKSSKSKNNLDCNLDNENDIVDDNQINFKKKKKEKEESFFKMDKLSDDESKIFIIKIILLIKN